MDDIEVKYIEEVRDLLSSAELKLMELLKRESKAVFVEEVKQKIVETIDAEVGVITEKAVGVLNSDGSKICWIPKKAIKNLAKIAIEQGKGASLIIEDWFQSKIKWVKNEPRG